MTSSPSDLSDAGVLPGADGGSDRRTVVVVSAAGTRYCLDVARVREIVSPGRVTVVPGAQRMTMGVINVRGRVLGLADLAVALGGPSTMASAGEPTRCETAVVLDLPGSQEIALAVDEVLDVVELANDSLQPPPAFGLGEAAPFAVGLVTLGDRLVVILDAQALFASDPAAASSDPGPAASSDRGAADLSERPAEVGAGS